MTLRNSSAEQLPEVTLDDVKREKIRRSLLRFTRYTKSDYRANWHHVSYASKLDQFMRGEIKNLMVFMPPQHGKSELSTRRAPAKMLGDNPDLKIGVIAYNHIIAGKFNREIQRIMLEDSYSDIYPGTRLITSNTKTNTYLRNVNEFEIVGKQGSLVTVGVGGGLTSRKLDIAIMDDLYKDAADAWSPVRREAVQDWYETVLRTRLHNDSQQLIVFTRWHEEDLAGYLLRTEPENWDMVLYEAIREQQDSPDDPREAGQPLWPQQHKLETLEKIRQNNPIVFDSLYQQNPTPKEGLLFPISELKRFKIDMIDNLKDNPPDGIVSACDIADEGDDSLCHVVGFMYGQEIYIIDVIFSQEPIEITQPMVAAMLDRYNIDRSRFESNNGGKGYAIKVRELRQGRTTVTWKHTAVNKHTRIIMKSGDIKEQFFFLDDVSIANHFEYKRFLYELSHYPKNGKVDHDDAADGITMLAEFAFGNRLGKFDKRTLGL